MLPYQRRMMAACIFAFSFIFFYEARGKHLFDVWGEPPVAGGALDHFWQQTITGCIVLALGGVLLFVLRNRDEKFRYSLQELMVVYLGVGLLIGTLVVSWMHVNP